MTEAQYQSALIKRLKKIFPGCVILKNDSSYQQGILDLTILYENKWATLEVKGSSNAPIQQNQEHYVEKFNKMSFGAFIYPENEAEVLGALQQAFASPG
jgi:hypothetical protein